jgi:TusA-related sulfurtransferase
MRCPLPVIELARAWQGVEVGQVIEVLADDPAAGPDLQAWARMKGQAYEESPAPDTHRIRRVQ